MPEIIIQEPTLKKGFFKHPLALILLKWLIPLFVAAGVLAAVGWWAHTTVEKAVKEDLTAELQTILNTNVATLKIWLQRQIAVVDAIAVEPQNKACIQDLVESTKERGTDAGKLRSSEPRGNNAALHGSHSGFDIQGCRQGLCREMFLWHMRQNFARIQEHGMATDWVDDRDPGITKAASEILYLADACANMIVLYAFCNAYRQSRHVTSGHATVGMQTLVNDHQLAGFFIQLGIVHCEKSADVYHRIFLGRHCGYIRKGTDFVDNFTH